MAAESGTDVHHRAPRCLLGLFDAAAEGFAGWSEFDAEAERWGIEVRGLSREGLRALIEGSTFEPLPPSIAGCTRKPVTSCGGAGAGVLEHSSSAADGLLAAR